MATPGLIAPGLFFGEVAAVTDHRYKRWNVYGG